MLHWQFKKLSNFWAAQKCTGKKARKCTNEILGPSTRWTTDALQRQKLFAPWHVQWLCSHCGSGTPHLRLCDTSAFLFALRRRKAWPITPHRQLTLFCEILPLFLVFVKSHTSCAPLMRLPLRLLRYWPGQRAFHGLHGDEAFVGYAICKAGTQICLKHRFHEMNVWVTHGFQNERLNCRYSVNKDGYITLRQAM